MHRDQIDAAFAARLVAGQFPCWSGLPVVPVDVSRGLHIVAVGQLVDVDHVASVVLEPGSDCTRPRRGRLYEGPARLTTPPVDIAVSVSLRETLREAPETDTP